jgi:hypothetical protein
MDSSSPPRCGRYLIISFTPLNNTSAFLTNSSVFWEICV